MFVLHLYFNCKQIVWSYLWTEIPDTPTAVAKGVYIPTAKRKVLGMFPSSGSGKVIFLYDEQQKKYLLAQCVRLMAAAHWHEDVERMTPSEWLAQFFLLIFDFRTALLSAAYHFNIHHLTPRGFRWSCIWIWNVCYILKKTLIPEASFATSIFNSCTVVVICYISLYIFKSIGQIHLKLLITGN